MFNILILLLSEISWNKGNNCCFTDCVKKNQPNNVSLCSDVQEMKLIQSKYEGRYYWTLHCDTSLIDFDLDSRSLEDMKVKTSAPVISQSFQSIWMAYGKLLSQSVSNLVWC